MDDLNLDELLEVNGGQNLAARYISTLAAERGKLCADGKIDTVALKSVMRPKDIQELESIRKNPLFEQALAASKKDGNPGALA